MQCMWLMLLYSTTYTTRLQVHSENDQGTGNDSQVTQMLLLLPSCQADKGFEASKYKDLPV